VKQSKSLYHGGHCPGKDFLIKSNAKPYVDRPLFENFIRHQFIPYITALRTNPCYSKAEAVLLMDNCSAHVTPEIFTLLGENHIKIVTFARHTTNISSVCLERKKSFGWIRVTIKPLSRRYTN
jgi:hypothetical protein